MTVSGCNWFKPKYDVKKQPEVIVSRTKEVCDVPLSFRFIADTPVKPAPDNGRQFPSNEQVDIYWKTEIEKTQICELVCQIRDILFICTYGQDKVVNAPTQCLNDLGELSCG